MTRCEHLGVCQAKPCKPECTPPYKLITKNGQYHIDTNNSLVQRESEARENRSL